MRKLLLLLLLLGHAMADQLPDLQTLQQAQQRAQALKPAQTDSRAWGWPDTGLEAAFGATMLGDYLQTRNITRAGRELNPVMGPKGDRLPPEVYFPAVMGLHYLAMKALPQPYRRLAQGLSIGFEGGVVGRNLGLGWGLHF